MKIYSEEERVAMITAIEQRDALISELVFELENIANADPMKWEADMRDQFQAWAQSRARFAIDKASGGKL